MQYLIICIESNCNHNSPSNLPYRWVLSMLVNGLQNLNPLIIGLNDQKSLLKIVVSLSKSSLWSHLIIVLGFYSWSANNNLGNTSNHSFETRPGPAGRPGTWQTHGWNRAGLKKKLGKEKPDVTWRVDPVKNPVATCWLLFFFTKTISFWF